LDLLYSFQRLFVAIFSTTGAISIVEGGRTIKGGRYVNSMFLTESKNTFINERQISSDYKFKVTFF